MAFKLVQKNAGSSAVEPDVISIGKTGGFFGEDVAKSFDDFDRCEIYLDYENARVGFKPTTNAITGFKIGKATDGLQRKSISGTWAKQVPIGRYRATQENGMWVISVGEIARRKNDAQPTNEM